MQALRLEAKQLIPDFSAANAPVDTAPMAPWLLGQQRCQQAWQLFQRCPGQHLFLSSFSGFDPESLLESLYQANPLVEAPGYLVAEQLESQQRLSKVPADQWQGESDQRTLLLELGGIRFVDQPLSRKTLLGTIDKEGHYHPGLLASCEVLVIPAEGLMDKPSRWLLIKEAIKRGYLAFSGSAVRIPLTCKLVVLGDALAYDALNAFDPEFADHVPLLAEAQPEWFVDNSEDLPQWLSCASATAQAYAERNLTPCGQTQLAQYASRLCEHQNRLSLAWHQLGQLLAQCEGEEEISAAHIKAALQAQSHRHNSVEIYAQRNVEEALVRVDTQGDKIGQINGLTVVDYFGHSYGEPARITVSVHYGDGEVADIERKSELGGNIHAKGMMILSACLYRLFGQDEPLHLSANIVFEQSYQTIDGDSASLAEYCCLMSTIADVPVKQSLALTGAIDQFGNVQAIGGINEKIEGFFHLCRYRGLTGDQGVILPSANLLQLNLSDEVVEAVNKGEFHLYHVDNAEDALALLTGKAIGEADKEGRYPEESLYGLVQDRLDLMAGNTPPPPGLLVRLLSKLRRDS
ncbi:S16 family serine protease [Ferrimonas marina]|uniref:endopeptidase La n=1 Tax=Ferrimonas marina TaxID=299255 RepID=A0A1M5NEM9_9GAMM|nr:S16 family serine protease [Ferrimonas marina]SHG88066.1 Lon protease (S16) C-terminal proteolytic domain-containing protein [Ferrimonas marina]